MIFHLVLLKLKPSATADELKNLYVGLKSLDGISGVESVQIESANKSVYVGYDDRTKGYTHALLVILSDKGALECYDKDPFHLLIKSTVIKPLLDTNVSDPVLAVDWEAEAPKLPTKSLLASNIHYVIAAAGVASLVGFLAIRSRL